MSGRTCNGAKKRSDNEETPSSGEDCGADVSTGSADRTLGPFYASRELRWALFLFCAVGIFVLSALPAGAFPELAFSGFDKVAHFLAFAVLAVTAAAAFAARPVRRPWKPVWMAFSFSVIYGRLIELYQQWVVVHRVGELGDLLADAVGAAAGLAGWFVIEWVIESRRKELSGLTPLEQPPEKT